jgi:cellulose biosynthesis protein BcsQ
VAGWNLGILEKTVRKLLVASQKSGVGKTTTSMNLAAATAQNGTRVLLLDADPLSNISTALNLAGHPHRQSLRQAGVGLPGVLVTNLVPGLDVLSPYEEGRCSDEDLDHLLRALSLPVSEQCYGCLIVDVPPFMGANPAQLVGSCDEFLLVMRAEPIAYRTLPAFLELMQRSGRNGHAIQMRGILLTLPEGEQPGCRWERELRGRFGARVLSEVIPHDETIGKALRAGQISSHLHPDSPAACQFRQLVGRLSLAEEARPAAAAEHVTQVLREAATEVAPVAAVVPAVVVPDLSPATPDEPVEVDRFTTTEPEPQKPAAPPMPRLRHLGRSGEVPRLARPERPLSPTASPVSPSGRVRVVAAAAATPIEPARPAPTAPVAPQVATANALGQLWPLWILLGAVLGGGLRFLPPSPSLFPILVGLGVAVVVVVALRTLTVAQNPAAPPASEDAPDRLRLRERKRNSGRVDKKDVSARLASRVPGARRDPHAN